MTPARTHDPIARLRGALAAPAATTRLQAALAAGTDPVGEQVEALVERCAVEPDFFVRDMLTWALVRHEPAAVAARLLPELTSDVAQARAQALHTLSKVRHPGTWPAITPALLRDPDDEVARAAWRAAVTLAPDDARAGLADALATQLGRGGPDVQRSLSRALVALEEAAADVVARAASAPDPGVGAHAIATQQLVQDPDAGFDAILAEAHRTVALRAAPTVRDRPDADR